VKIHPAIGVARLGNSPTDFFIGPETMGTPVPPPGGYKDGQCRVKRQAARFRLYAYDGSGVATELTTATADITWTVELGNRKASSDGFSSSGRRNNNAVDRSKLDILPGSRLLHGPSQLVKFNTGTITVWRADLSSATATVDLGEARTDPEGRLLVLGGFGVSASPTGRPLDTAGDLFNKDEWYDDISDGPIQATVKINATGQTFTAEGAWVIVAPPKYAPPLINAITLWDRLFDFFVDKGMLPAPTTTSFARDIYPILRAALDVQDVNAGASGQHNPYIVPADFPVADATKRATIFNALKNPSGGGGNMPLLNGSATLTKTQYAHMQRWKDGTNIDNTWPVAPPALSPQELDRAALFHCVGAAFFPGIEAGDFTIGDSARYSTPFRFNQGAVRAGDVSSRMSLPWQTDFSACANNWWPANRPNQVRTTPGGPVSLDWDRNHQGGGKMVTDWPILGFVLDQSGERLEVERCDEAFVSLVTTQLLFQDVPQGPGGTPGTTARAVVFEISSTGSPVTLEYVSGATANGLARLQAGPFSFGPTSPGETLTVRLWITYTTGAVGSSVSDNLVVRHQQSGKTWTVPIQANTVARQTTAVALALDRSGSMSDPTGAGVTKIQALKDAVSIFTDVALPGDGLGAAQFNQAAAVVRPVTALGPDNPFDPSRANFKTAVDALTPGGATSIGGGLQEARTLLQAAPGFNRQALVVLTDGMENSPPMIADVAPTINAFTYAIGLGDATNINAQALQTLAGNRGGYLLLTGPLTGDNRFIITKYFLQILAGISNEAIITDPQGALRFGETHRIPFLLTETEMLADVILLTPFPKALQFEIETPYGIHVTPTSGHPGVTYVDTNGLRFYRLRLPLLALPQRPVQAGLWYALVTQRERVSGEGPQLPGGRVPYNVSVQAGTNLALHALLRQDAYKPGAVLYLHARLTFLGIPWEAEARVWAELTAPDRGTGVVKLDLVGPGDFVGKYPTIKSGVYTFRVRAEGKTPHGWQFQREQTVTGAVAMGGEQEPDPRRLAERARAEEQTTAGRHHQP
jgi:hypothetical protein